MSSAVVVRGLEPVQGSRTAFWAMKSRLASKTSRETPAASRVAGMSSESFRAQILSTRTLTSCFSVVAVRPRARARSA